MRFESQDGRHVGRDDTVSLKLARDEAVLICTQLLGFWLRPYETIKFLTSCGLVLASILIGRVQDGSP